MVEILAKRNQLAIYFSLLLVIAPQITFYWVYLIRSCGDVRVSVALELSLTPLFALINKRIFSSLSPV